MRLRLVVSLVVLLALLGGADVAARTYAEGKLAERAEASVQGSHAEAHIKSFPFVARLLLSGEVQHVSLKLAPVATARIQLSDVVLTLDGLELDRNRLFQGKVEPTGIRHGTVAFEINEAELSRVVGRRVTIEAGRAFVDVGGHDVDARVTTNSTSLAFDVGGLPLVTVPINRADLIPCRPAVAFATGVLRLSCTFDHLPPALVQAAAGASS